MAGQHATESMQRAQWQRAPLSIAAFRYLRWAFVAPSLRPGPSMVADPFDKMSRMPAERNAIYFVGAGFSRALAKGRNVPPLLTDFIARMADAIDDDTIAVALAGMYRDALLSADTPHVSPATVHALADGPVAARTPSRRTEFALAIKSVAQPDVESLLATEAAKATMSNARFRFAISRMFHRMSWDLNLGCLRRLIRARRRSGIGAHSIVTFNYDLILEHVLEEEVGWNGANGYGLEMPFGVFVDAFDKHADTVNQHDVGVAPRLDAVPLHATRAQPEWTVLKPHGSLNWLRRSKAGGQHERLLVVAPSTRVAYPVADSYMNISVPGRMPGAFNIQLVAPEESKVGLADVLALESQALESTHEVWVIGWSVPQTDRDQRALIRAAVARRSRPIDRLVVVNLNAPDDYFTDVAGLFGVGEALVERHNRGLLCFCRLCLMKEPHLA